MSSAAAGALVVEERDYLHPDVSLLIDRVQAEYGRIFGGPDATPMDPAQFGAPLGRFLVGYAAGMPVAMAGWRRRDDGRAELKRMYVADEARGRGYSRVMLAAIEESAAAAGATAVILETHERQPAALALYCSAGYTDIPQFGHYADEPLTVCLERRLARE
jgi:GNAT superfamily N-acetyltransferase